MIEAVAVCFSMARGDGDVDDGPGRDGGPDQALSLLAGFRGELYRCFTKPPARVRRGFRAIHDTLPALTAAPKPGKPGPGRPPGSRNRHPATRHDVGKTITKKATQKTTPSPTG